jgi:hypothetical protein
VRADGARGQPRHWNGAHWPCPRQLTETTARPADLYVGPRFNQPSAWAVKSAGLAIVSSRLIGDDGARPEVGWVPLEMDERPVSFFPWKVHETIQWEKVPPGGVTESAVCACRAL